MMQHNESCIWLEMKHADNGTPILVSLTEVDRVVLTGGEVPDPKWNIFNSAGQRIGDGPWDAVDYLLPNGMLAKTFDVESWFVERKPGPYIGAPSIPPCIRTHFTTEPALGHSMPNRMLTFFDWNGVPWKATVLDVPDRTWPVQPSFLVQSYP